MRDEEETDVDCGGRVCARCSLGARCERATDCAKANDEVQHLRDQLVQMRAEGGPASSSRSLSISQSHASASALSSFVGTATEKA